MMALLVNLTQTNDFRELLVHHWYKQTIRARLLKRRVNEQVLIST